jgi:hypothetical protein
MQLKTYEVKFHIGFITLDINRIVPLNRDY